MYSTRGWSDACDLLLPIEHRPKQEKMFIYTNSSEEALNYPIKLQERKQRKFCGEQSVI